MDFDNDRRILGIPGAPWAEAGPGSLNPCSLSVSAGAPRGAAKRYPRAGTGWWYFPRLRLALLGVVLFQQARRRTRGDAPPKVSGQECRSSPVSYYAYTRFSTNSLSSQSSMFVELSLRVRRVSRTQGQLLARHQGCKQHRASVGGGYSLVTAECGDGAWCVIQQKNYFEIRCHLNLLPT